jgi:Leucine-rich repeat (LRR) protein
LGRLTDLDLRNNELTALPKTIASLQNLTHLDLRGNRLTSVPEGIRELPGLEKLDLRWNKLRAPGWLEALERRGCAVLL